MKQFIKLLFSYIATFHYIAYKMANNEIKSLIDSDVEEMNRRYKQCHSLCYWLTFYAPYRNLFYYRIGRKSRFLKLILPPYKWFFIHNGSIGRNAFVLNHPYGTIINAKSIGNNFTCCQLTTIGNGKHGRNDLVPTIGNNVSLGANVTILGDITIGDNVIVGAGSVVVKDVPSNCMVAGNPAVVKKSLEVL